MQHRIDKINSEIQRIIAEIVKNLKDPRLAKMISITGVDATNDLKQAKVYISVLGDENDKKEALTGLKNAEGFIRRELGEKIDLHSLPELLFEIDNSIENGMKIDSILKEISGNE